MYKSAAVRRCRPISAVRVREGISKIKKKGGGVPGPRSKTDANGAFRDHFLTIVVCLFFVFRIFFLVVRCCCCCFIGAGGYHRSADVAAEIF